MAKLKGKAKAAFLARMARGRAKAAGGAPTTAKGAPRKKAKRKKAKRKDAKKAKKSGGVAAQIRRFGL